MLEEGYLLRTDGEYSVLKMGDITRLKEETARVLVRRSAEKETPSGSRKTNKRSTDALASAGFKLFEKLRQLRLAIAGARFL